MTAQEFPVGINYSMGSSSEWMIRALAHGVIARPEHVAVFCANTGDEHEWSYERREEIVDLCKAEGIPFFYVATHRNETLSEAILSATRGERTRLDNPPFWTENQGGGRGQLDQRCTAVWKTSPIRRAQTEWLASIGKPKKISTWIGYGRDEQHRAEKTVRKNDVQWAQPDFPVIRLGRSRAQQRAEIAKWTGRDPVRFSACVQCPFLDPQRRFQQSAKDRARSIEIDEAIRDGLRHVAVEEPAYITDRLIPLERLYRVGDPQPSLPGFESGCDAGQCFL